MGKVIDIWHYQAILEGLKALDKFNQTKDREQFKKWSKKYSNKIKKKGGK